MRRPVESFELICDRCGTNYEDGDFTIFGPGWDPEENAVDGDWWCHGYMTDDHRGPDSRDLCPKCHTAEWVDDDTVLAFTERPIPDPHPIVRDPRYTAPVVPGEWCRAESCGLMAKHPVHREVAK